MRQHSRAGAGGLRRRESRSFSEEDAGARTRLQDSPALRISRPEEAFTGRGHAASSPQLTVISQLFPGLGGEDNVGSPWMHPNASFLSLAVGSVNPSGEVQGRYPARLQSLQAHDSQRKAAVVGTRDRVLAAIQPARNTGRFRFTTQKLPLRQGGPGGPPAA